MAVRKWSVSVDENLAEAVERHVGDRGLSGFVAQAVENELERVRLVGSSMTLMRSTVRSRPP